MGSWGRGASGGMQSQSMIGDTSTGGGTGQDSRANRYQLLYIDFQYKLEKYLRGSQLSIEDVCQWIKVNNH